MPKGNRTLITILVAPHFLGHTILMSLKPSAAFSMMAPASTVPSHDCTGRQVAELICQHVSSVESVQFLNTGSEASYRQFVGRAIHGRDHVIVMQAATTVGP